MMNPAAIFPLGGDENILDGIDEIADRFTLPPVIRP